MANYKHILYATDLFPDNEQVAERAGALAASNQARLSVLHVVENFPIYFANELVLPETQEIESQLLARARERMQGLAARHGFMEANCHVVPGITKMEILDFIKDHDVDLVVLGSHSHKGLGRLLGSTANAVLNAAPCDVMAVRIVAND